MLCLGTTVGLRLMEVKVANVVVKNSRIVSFEHPLMIAIAGIGVAGYSINKKVILSIKRKFKEE